MSILRAALAFALALPLAVSPATEHHDITLADHALILGPTGYPVPSDGMMDSFVQGYLNPLGFDGSYAPFWTPETGAYDSIDIGRGLLTAEIINQFQAGDLDDNPLWVVGYSQSASIISAAMPELAAAGIPADDLHFVLFGNPASPGGIFPELLGWLYSILPTWLREFVDDIVRATGFGEWLGLDGGVPLETPTDLYAVDNFVVDGDGYAQWDNGANIGGLFWNHLMYPGLDISDFHVDSTVDMATLWESGQVGDALAVLWDSLVAVS